MTADSLGKTDAARSNPPLPQILGQPAVRRESGRLKPLHVLTLTPFYPSERNDVFGCFVAEPVEQLQSAGVVNTVFALRPFYRGSARAPRSSVDARWMRYFSLPGSVGLSSAGAFVFARLVADVRRLHANAPIDVIHAHAPLPCGHAAMLLHAELKLPYVVSVHGLDAFGDDQVRGHAGKWSRRISQRVYRGASRVICISEHVRERVLEGAGRVCRTSVVYNGVDSTLFSPAETVTAQSLSVLSVGNLIPIKGHDVLIRAVASIAAEFPQLTLEIVGDGSERQPLQALAEQLGIAERVQFRGTRNRHEVAEAMRRCSVFALPSRYEGLGCVYLEAMSVGKAVIGCRGQGIAEIIQHGSNGFLVGPGNEKELALALSMLLRDENLRQLLGLAARDTVLDRLTLEQQASHLIRIYRESLK